MSAGEGAERSAEIEGSPGESSLYTLDESEESDEEEDSSNVNGQSGGASGDGSGDIQRQSVPTGDDAAAAVDDGDAITDAGVATDENGASQKLSETESDKIEVEDEDIAEIESGQKRDVKKVKQRRDIEYITPIEDPYQKALKYFAKHNILELFGDITALIVLHRPDNPYNLMVDELVKRHETESMRGHVMPLERRYVPPKKAVSSVHPSPEGAEVGSTDAAKGTTDDDEERFDSLDIEIANMLKKLIMGFGSLKDVPGDTPAQSDSGIALGGQEGSLHSGQADDQAEELSLSQADKQSEELSVGQKSRTETEKEVVSGRFEQDEGGGHGSTGDESVKKKESNGSAGHESVNKKVSSGSTAHENDKMNSDN